MTFTFYFNMYNNMFLIFILSILALVELMDIPDRNAYKIFSGMKRGFKDLLISKKLNNFQNDLSLDYYLIILFQLRP